MELTTTVERLGDVIDRQTVKVGWMRQMLEQYGPQQPVEVRSRVTPMGTFLHDVQPVEGDYCDVFGCHYDAECVCTTCGGQASCEEKGCWMDAVPQSDWDALLCQEHVDEAWRSHFEELAYDAWKENR